MMLQEYKMGRNHKGFTPSQKTQEKAKQRYAQGGLKSLREYLHRWRTWVQAGLHFKILNVDEIVSSLVERILTSAKQIHRPEPCQAHQSAINGALLKTSTRITHSICSELDGVNIQ